MRLTIHHETRYAYDMVPNAVIELLRLTPCNTDTQSVRDWRILVSGDARLQKAIDAFGNVTHTFSGPVPGEGLVITATGTVETSGNAGVVSGTRERLPVSVFLRETPLTQPDAAIQTLARSAAAGSDGNPLNVGHALNLAVNKAIAFKPGATDVNTPAAEALAKGEGVCQDLTHVLIAAARVCGIPARYVSGYQFSDGHARDEHAGHAWAELYADGLGWVGFDPTAGGSTDETYVRVAVGLDTLGAGPVRGAIYGGLGEHLSVHVSMEGTGHWPQGGPGQSQSQTMQSPAR